MPLKHFLFFLKIWFHSFLLTTIGSLFQLQEQFLIIEPSLLRLTFVGELNCYRIENMKMYWMTKGKGNKYNVDCRCGLPVVYNFANDYISRKFKAIAMSLDALTQKLQSF